MVRPPEFITFTGADDHTNIAEMAALSRQYPIEWGILLSPRRQGTGRYPGDEAISRFWWSGLRLAAHLCGEHARRIMAGDLIKPPADLWYCKRIQVNHEDPNPRQIIKFRNGWGKMRCVAQCRGEAFPADTFVDWLYDRSGGTGQPPETWPQHPGRLVGYAGGIGPDNVASVLAAIAAEGPYWIDMETKVRTDDRFDPGLCRRVCEIVYGEPSR